jgi:uncharacterized protein YdeI (BOF family)
MRYTALAFVLLVPLALAACGGGSKSSNTPTLTPVAYVRSAAAKTAKSSSEHMTLKGSVGVQGQLVTLNGAGDFDTPSESGTMHLDFNVGGLTGGIDEVVQGTTVYMKSPLFADGLPKGKTWIKLDLQKAGAQQGIDFSALGSQDPTQTLAQLQRVGSATEVGDETVGGIETTHYRAKIDITKAPQGAKIEALTNAKYGPYDLWIGKDDGLVRRMKFSITMSPAGAARQVISMTLDFSDFGKDVNVSVPAPADTFDATDTAIKGLGG